MDSIFDLHASLTARSSDPLPHSAASVYRADDVLYLRCIHGCTVIGVPATSNQLHAQLSGTPIWLLICSELNTGCRARRGSKSNREGTEMQTAILKLYVKSQIIWQTLKDENGQDLVEYGLVLVLVCLAATAGMNTLASGINVAMTNITAKLSKYTS